VNEVAGRAEGKPGRYGLVCSEIISGHDGRIGDDFFVEILIFKKKALVQSMTDSCSYLSMWRVFDTLSSRGFAIPTLRSRWSLSMGLLRFSLSEAAKKSVFFKLEPKKTVSLQTVL